MRRGLRRFQGVQSITADQFGQQFPQGGEVIEQIETEARRFGAVRSYVDTMSVQAPDFYQACGYQSFGTIDGYPGGVTRHWFTKAL